MTKRAPLLGKIRFHPLTTIFIVLSLLTANFYTIFTMLILVLCHELGHAIMAAHFKWPIQRITILPFGGELKIATFTPKSIREEALVVIAGPFQHVLLFALALLIQPFGWFSQTAITTFNILNFTILITNLYPVWPLDGGRLLYLGLAKALPIQQAKKITLIISALFLVGFLAALLLLAPTHLSSWILFTFLVQAIWQENKNRPIWFMQFLLGKKQATFIKRQIVVEQDEPLMRVLGRFYKNQQHSIIVQNKGVTIGVLEESRLLKAFFEEKRPLVSIGALLVKK